MLREMDMDGFEEDFRVIDSMLDNDTSKSYNKNNNNNNPKNNENNRKSDQKNLSLREQEGVNRKP